jgi:hypothetical protein
MQILHDLTISMGIYSWLDLGLTLYACVLCLWDVRRYIITNKSISRSSSACSSDESARSQRSTPAALSSRSNDPFLGEYATYYKSWRELATSKTEQDAARMLLLGSLSDPSFRLRSNTQPVRKSIEGNAGGEAKAQAANKTKQKRQQHLERMKRAWRVTDLGATVNNEIGTEDFLYADVGKQGHHAMHSVGGLSPAGTPIYVSTHHSWIFSHVPGLNPYLFSPGQNTSGRSSKNVDMLHSSPKEKRYTCMHVACSIYTPLKSAT